MQCSCRCCLLYQQPDRLPGEYSQLYSIGTQHTIPAKYFLDNPLHFLDLLVHALAKSTSPKLLHVYLHAEHTHRHHDSCFRHFLLHYHITNFNPHHCGFVFHVQCYFEPHQNFEPFVEPFFEPLVEPYQDFEPLFEPLDEPFSDFEPYGVVPLEDFEPFFEPPVNFEPFVEPLNNFEPFIEPKIEPFFELMADFDPFFESIKNFEPF